MAAHQGLRLLVQSCDGNGTLDGSDISLGPQAREDEVLRELAGWELRGVDHDEDMVFTLRDSLQDMFCARTLEARRRDADVVLTILDIALDKLERGLCAEITRVRQLGQAARHWTAGGSVPETAIRYCQIAYLAIEQSCERQNAGTCRCCQANVALGEFYTHFDIENTVLRIFDWAQGRDLEKDLRDTLEELLRCETLGIVSSRLFAELQVAVEAALSDGDVHNARKFSRSPYGASSARQTIGARQQ